MCPCMREHEIKSDVSLMLLHPYVQSDNSMNMKSTVLAPTHMDFAHTDMDPELKLMSLCFLSCSTPGRRTCR